MLIVIIQIRRNDNVNKAKMSLAGINKYYWLSIVRRKGRMVSKLIGMDVLVAEKGKLRNFQNGGKGDKDRFTLSFYIHKDSVTI